MSIETMNGLKEILGRGVFVSATQVAIEMGCSKRVAIKRLRTLRKTGAQLQTVKVREGLRGPESIAYALVLDGE